MKTYARTTPISGTSAVIWSYAGKSVPYRRKCVSQFHPVGQGLFYSSKITSSNNKQKGEYSFVYDCGSKSPMFYLDRAIANYDAPDYLDLLIISHFHEDHINGIPELMKRTGGVHEVVLPYLHPAEKLLVAAGMTYRTRFSPLTREFISILLNPKSFFGIDTTITFISPGPPNEDWPDHAVGQKSHGSNWIPPRIIKQSVHQQDPDTKPHSSRLFVSDWIFKFYCRVNLTYTVEEILDEIEDEGIDLSADLSNIFENNIDDLVQAYLNLYSDDKQNSITLLCCHGPQFSASAKKTGPYFQMLTGDAEITKPIIELENYEVHFNKELEKTVMFSIPHHGSSRDWHDDFIPLHKNCELWVVTAGHAVKTSPSKKVLKCFTGSPEILSICDEESGIELDIFIPEI